MTQESSKENADKNWCCKTATYVPAFVMAIGIMGGVGYSLLRDMSVAQRMDEIAQFEAARKEALQRVPADAVITSTITEDYAGVMLPRTITTKKTFAQAAKCQEWDSGRLRSVVIGGENGKGWKEVAVLCP